MTTIEQVKKIAQDHQADRVDGVIVDAFTAGIISQVYDALNDENREKLGRMPVEEMAKTCYKLIK